MQGAPKSMDSPAMDIYDEFSARYRPEAIVSPPTNPAALVQDSVQGRGVPLTRPRPGPVPVPVRPGDVVQQAQGNYLPKYTKASPSRMQQPVFDPMFSPSASAHTSPRKTAREEHDERVLSAVKRFDALAMPDDDERPESPTPKAYMQSPPLAPEEEDSSDMLTPVQEAVYAQFSGADLDDHECMPDIQAAFVSVAMLASAQVPGGPKAQCSVYFGADHPDNKVELLDTKELTPATAKRTPLTAAAVVRRAELNGVIRALRLLLLQPLRRKCVHVCVSSAYVAKAWGTWIPDWETNGWPGDEPEARPGSRAMLRQNSSSQGSRVHTPNGTYLDTDNSPVQRSPLSRSPRNDPYLDDRSEIRSMQAQRAVPSLRGAELLSTPKRSALRTPRHPAESESSSAESPLAPESASPNSSSRSRKRRLVDEDLLKELAALRAQHAEADYRGGARIHLYLIERTHNPAAIALHDTPTMQRIQRPSSRSSVRSNTTPLRPRRSEPNLAQHARSPAESVRSPAMESVKSPALDAPRSRSRGSARGDASPLPKARSPIWQALPPGATFGTPVYSEHSPNSPAADRFERPESVQGRTRRPRRRQGSVQAGDAQEPKADAAAAPSALPAAQAQAQAPPQAPAQAPSAASESSDSSEPKALTMEALQEHNRRTGTGKSSRFPGRRAMSTKSGARSESGFSIISRLTSKMFRKHDAAGNATTMPTEQVSEQATPVVPAPQIPDAPTPRAAPASVPVMQPAPQVYTSPRPSAHVAAPDATKAPAAAPQAPVRPNDNALGIVLKNTPDTSRAPSVLAEAPSPRPSEAPSTRPVRRRMPRSAPSSTSHPDLRKSAQAQAAPALPTEFTWDAPVPATRSPRVAAPRVASPAHMSRGTAWLASEAQFAPTPVHPADRVRRAPEPVDDGFGSSAALPNSSPYARRTARHGATSYSARGAQFVADSASESE